ncbi:hypothetical protein RM780_19000 [Streptomyces sp. DSM 44917]|uniref:Integral membrane protein n=1 Tax=Streptomyces boetiae TaxID=3075541 RepID=A0ABU2LBS2_9ACTN|nr:hypothetical protein [Streptomyces sp. DSM 44917]MDT0309032.1 hypothetical protein [Streptomyces sp. DSM 44917]
MSDTRRSLVRRSAALLALTAATVVVLFAAYRGVHDTAAPLREETAPAILDVTAARNALREAGAVSREGPGSGGFRVQIAVANQSLARAAEAGVLGEPGLRTLETVTGLIVSFSGWLELADRLPDEAPLREAYLHYAEHMLTGSGSGSGILERLDTLQTGRPGPPEEGGVDGQADVLADQASFGWPLRAAWALALLGTAALVALLAETQVFLHRRFRRLLNPWLLAATLTLVLGVAALAVLAAQTHDAKAASRADLAGILAASEPAPGGAGSRDTDTDSVARTIRTTAEEVAADMRDTDWRAGLTGLVPILGLVLVAQVTLGVAPRIAEYRYRSR